MANLLSQAFDADSQILSHEPSLDGLDAHCFKRLAEGFQLCVVVQLCSVQQATCPGKDGGCETSRFKIKSAILCKDTDIL